MKKIKLFLVFVSITAPGCKTLTPLTALEDAKCKTEIAKDSKFICEFEGKKLIGKKINESI